MTLPASADAVVIGLGAAGAAALASLARAGVNAVGIDRYAPPHDMGSTHGETRLLRTAYSEGAAYVPMAFRSIALWRALEARTGRQLFRQTGVAYHGPRSSPFLADARKAAAIHPAVRLEDRTEGLATPALAMPADWQHLVDRDGGYLDCEGGIAALLQDATAHGAGIVSGCECLSVTASPHEVEIATMSGTIRADFAVVTAGAWTRELVPALESVTHVERRVLHWFEDADGSHREDAGFLPFLAETEDHVAFYGFPADAQGEVKVAEHFVTERVASPAALDRRVTARDVDFITPLATRFLPRLGRHIRAGVCMYPMSRDEHFIVDRLPDNPRLIVGAGLSGHGYKFAPVLGEALAAFVTGRAQEIDVEFFALRRFPEFG